MSNLWKVQPFCSSVKQRFNHSFVADHVPQTFAVMNLHESSEEVWYLDTGACNQMTANSSILSSFKPYIGHKKILVGNENLLDTTQIYETQLNTSSTSFALKNILVVSSIKRNLLSMRQFCHDNNFFFEFDPFGFSVKDKETQMELFRCSSSGIPLYQISSKVASAGNNQQIGLVASLFSGDV